MLKEQKIVDNLETDLPKYMNISLSFEERAKDLVSRMTLDEKISQMRTFAKPIKRLGIPSYVWWGECLHGLVTSLAGWVNGLIKYNHISSTVFAQPIGLGASFNLDLVFKMTTAISDEARAIYHNYVRKNIKKPAGGMFRGLTLWSPNLNIFRDPRWGRGQETYGEDPYLIGKMGVAFVKGLQGEDPKYRKTDATPKHFACYNGPGVGRASFNVIVNQKDFRETYLAPFKDCFIEGNAAATMSSYHRINDIPACENNLLLQQILRDEWNFDGYTVSDCYAVFNVYKFHKVADSIGLAAANAVINGTDLINGFSKRGAYIHLGSAVEKGLISEEEVTRAVTRLFKTRFELGMFDPPEMVPYSKISMDVVECEKHRDLALQTARESIVLLKNENNILPLNEKYNKIAVIGPNSDVKSVMWGSYHGIPSKTITPLQGIKERVNNEIQVLYSKGCDLIKDSEKDFEKAVKIAQKSDLIILCLGLSQKIEAEVISKKRPTDRNDLKLPPIQEKLLLKIYETEKPIILVLLNGSPINLTWAHEHLSAIIEAWYPGQEGGTAIAEVLFGDYCPAGKLPVTFPKSINDVLPFADYSMKGRTYRYTEKEPLYPFGYGLSYTKFNYSNLKLSSKQIEAGSDENLEISIEVENNGNFAGDEIIQLYVKDIEASVEVPHHSLQGFKRVFLEIGEKKEISFILNQRQMAIINNDGRCILEPGEFKIYVGGSQPDKISLKLLETEVLEDTFEVTGKKIDLKY